MSSLFRIDLPGYLDLASAGVDLESWEERGERDGRRLGDREILRSGQKKGSLLGCFEQSAGMPLVQSDRLLTESVQRFLDDYVRQCSCPGKLICSKSAQSARNTAELPHIRLEDGLVHKTH